MSEYLSFYAANLAQYPSLFVASIPGKMGVDGSTALTCLKNDAR